MVNIEFSDRLRGRGPLEIHRGKILAMGRMHSRTSGKKWPSRYAYSVTMITRSCASGFCTSAGAGPFKNLSDRKDPVPWKCIARRIPVLWEGAPLLLHELQGQAGPELQRTP